MFNVRNQTVNVDRRVLLEKLRDNAKKHEAEYYQAVCLYKQTLEHDLEAALKQVRKSKNSEDLFKIRVDFTHPISQSSGYKEAINMLEYSVDETIELNTESFKAFINNEWAWSGQFNQLIGSYMSKLE